MAYTSANHKLDAVARDLFFKLYTRRIRVRLIGITFTKLVRGTYQINMFEDTEQILKLYLAMDRMKNKHGIHAVTRGVGFDLKMRRR